MSIPSQPSVRTAVLVPHVGLLLVLAWIGSTCCFVSSARAQHWKKIYQDNVSYGCGYFFDELHGMIGSGVRPVPLNGGRIAAGKPIRILKTTDGGLSWSQAKVPFGYKGAVTQIFMRDSLFGYASIFTDKTYPDPQAPASPSLWYTTDGGTSWNVFSQLQGEAACVYETKHALICTSWDNFNYGNRFGFNWGNISTNGGISWMPQSGPQGNGIDFVNDTIGVATQLSSSNYGFWRTTDGGVNWLPVPLQKEAWSVYGVKGTSTFLVANEGTQSIIHCSTDNGATWFIRYQFPFQLNLNGSIAGLGGRIYAQTDSAVSDQPASIYRGMVRSDDTGKTWHRINGPDNSRDSRFVVTGCSGEVVYAFDGFGGVWKTTDGGDGSAGAFPGLADFTIHNDSLAVRSTQCTDTIRLSLQAEECTSITVDSAVPYPASLTIRKLTIKKDVAKRDTLFLQTVCDVQDTAQSGYLRVYGHEGSRSYWHDVPVTINALPKRHLTLDKDTIRCYVQQCASVGDSVRIQFIGCGNFDVDSVHFSDPRFIVKSSLPIQRGVTSITIPVSLIPDLHQGFQGVLQLYAQTNGTRLDTIIPIIVTLSNLAPTVQYSTPKPVATQYCTTVRGAFTLGYGNCDSLTVDSVVSSNGAFHIDHTPTVLRSTSSDSLTFSFEPSQPDTTHGTIHLYVHNTQRSFDTTIQLTGYNDAVPNRLLLNRTRLQFTTANCLAQTDSILLTARDCDTLTIDSIRTSDASVALGTLQKNKLVAGSSSYVSVLYAPDQRENSSTQVHIYAHNRSTTIDTTIAITYTNTIAGAPFELDRDTVRIVTYYCQPSNAAITITNNNCDSAVIESATIENDRLQEFSLSTLGSIGSLNSATIPITFTPDSSSTRTVFLHLKGHAGLQSFDTLIPLVGTNNTAPEPYLLPVRSAFVNDTLLIPIYLHETKESFSFRNYEASLSFNTDLLHTVNVETAGTLSDGAAVSVAAGTNTAHVRGSLQYILDQTNDLTKPLFLLRVIPMLTVNTQTTIQLDTFTVDAKPLLELCSKPLTAFTLEFQCGDSMIVSFMQHGTSGIQIESVHPDPARQGSSVTVNYNILSNDVLPLQLDVVTSSGAHVKTVELPSGVGLHQKSITPTLPAGAYFLLLHRGKEATLSKLIVN